MLRRDATRGFTLIELIITVLIFGVLLSLGIPAYQDWVARTKIRVAAETLAAGLANARNQALQRNAQVIFSLTDTLSTTCVPSSTATNWIISLADPTSHCNAAPSEIDAPQIIEKRSGSEGTSRTTLTARTSAGAAATNIIFTGLGRTLLQNSAGIDMNPISTIDVSYPDAGACKTSGGGGPVRCLRIEISTGGQPRICDPVITDSNDPRYCTP